MFSNFIGVPPHPSNCMIIPKKWQGILQVKWRETELSSEEETMR
jgi:hypothetical protein